MSTKAALQRGEIKAKCMDCSVLTYGNIVISREIVKANSLFILISIIFLNIYVYIMMDFFEKI
jgi:hypothetical protein